MQNALNAKGWGTSCGFLKTGRQQEFNAQQATAKKNAPLQDLVPSNDLNRKPAKTWFS